MMLKKLNLAPKEKDIEAKICALIKRHGGIAYKFTSPARRSVPDRLVLMPSGVIFFLEVKRPGAKATVKQEREHERMRALGATVFVVDNVADVELILDVFGV